MWNPKRSPTAMVILRKKNKVGGITLLDIKQCYKARVIKTVCQQHKDRCIGYWDIIESLEINPCLQAHLIYEKGGKNIQWGKDNK